MRSLVESGSGAHLFMFGVGSLEGRLRTMCKGYEARIHLGGCADPGTVIAYMSACDWLVIPSRIESIPLVFGDALQMHLPVIAADVGDLGSLVRRYGVGKVVEPSNPRALASAMQEACSTSRSQFGRVWDEPLKTFDIRRSALRCQESLATR
jgi:glycosyltransferase involved in cell wall biosynthesis